MKRIKFLIITFLLAISYTFNAQSNKLIKESFKVWGECGMCQEKIENTTNELEGVKSSKWNISSKIITVKYDPSKTSIEKIQKVIASAGYDTEMYTADNKDYNNLHFCCQYERKQ